MRVFCISSILETVDMIYKMHDSKNLYLSMFMVVHKRLIKLNFSRKYRHI